MSEIYTVRKTRILAQDDPVFGQWACGLIVAVLHMLNVEMRRFCH